GALGRAGAFGFDAGAAVSAVSGVAGSGASRAVRSMTGGFTGPPFRSAMNASSLLPLTSCPVLIAGKRQGKPHHCFLTRVVGETDTNEMGIYERFCNTLGQAKHRQPGANVAAESVG